MHRSIIYILLVSFLIIILITSVLGERSQAGVLFLLIGPGARATGMGEAFTAVANDATSTYWNPAGLGRRPLSSSWDDIELPGKKEPVAIGLTKIGLLLGGSSGKFDLWLATEGGLHKFVEEEWVDYEEYFTYDSQSVWDMLKYFYRKPDGERISGLADFMAGEERIIELLNKYNEFTISSLKDYLPLEITVKIPFKIFLGDKRITAMVNKYPLEDLWIGTNRGVLRRTSEAIWSAMDQNDAPYDKEIRVLESDGDDNIWAATNSGLYFYKNGEWHNYTKKDGLPSDNITSLSIVSSYKMWAGTDKGPVKYNGKQWVDYYYYHPPTANQSWRKVTSDLFGSTSREKIERQASVIMSYNGSGGANLDDSVKESAIKIPFDAAFGSPIAAIYETNDGIVWFGTELGIKAFQNELWTSYGYKSTVIEDNKSLASFVRENWKDLDESLIDEKAQQISKYNVLSSENLSKGEAIDVPVNPASSKVYVISEVPGNNILFATQYGAISYNEEQQRFQYYTGGGLNKESVRDISNQGRTYWFQGNDRLKVYTRGERGLAMMHTNWLPELAADIYYSFLAGTFFLEGWGTLGLSIIFVSEGRNVWTSSTGLELGNFKSYETAVAVSYGTEIISDVTAGLSFKFLYSQLAPAWVTVDGKETQPATSFALDAGLHYEILEGFNIGTSLQNVGPPVQYVDAHQSDPLPINLKMGLSYCPYKDKYSELLLSTDIHKGLINFGEEPLQREFRQAQKCLGVEYTYSNFVSVRFGYLIDYDYHYEPSLGEWIGTNYFTFGLGLKYSDYKFDFSYIPEQIGEGNTSLPLSNIMRASLNTQF